MLTPAVVTPRPYTPTDEQRSFIVSDASALILAGPGRGKTATAIAAALDWLRRRPSDSVLFTSFSNAAVLRIGEAAGLAVRARDRRLKFRTFHSIAMEVLRDFGRYVGLRKPVRALDGAERRIVEIDRAWFSLSLSQRAEQLKLLAQEEGHVAFELMVPLATAMLVASEAMRRAVGARYPFIVVDEFQDTRSDQWEFLKLIGERSRVLAMGDPDQMIYQLEHDAAAQRISAFATWKGIQPTRLTGQNFRCGVPAIPTFAEALLHGTRIERPERGVRIYGVHRPQLRAKLAELWSFIRDRFGSDVTIGFIAPSSVIAHRIAGTLKNPGATVKVRIPIHAHVAADDGDLDTFRFAVCAGADWVRCKDGPTSNRLVVALAGFWASWARRDITVAKIEAIAKSLRPGGRSARPLRDYLAGADLSDIRKFADGMLTAMQEDNILRVQAQAEALRHNGLPSFRGMVGIQDKMFEEYRCARVACGFAGDRHSRARTSMLTMYRAKGREFDYAIMIVDPRAHIATATIDELRRLHYVAATRARKGLAVVYVRGEEGPVLAPVVGVPEGDSTSANDDE